MSNAALAVKPAVHALDIHPVAGRIGAEIRGVHLSGELDAATVEAIQQALIQYKVVFFREQTQLDDQRQEAFAHLLGEPVAHPTVPSREGTRYLLELDGAEGQRANSWHTDVTFVDAYPKASILRSVVAPAFGGDTLWANTATAYNELPTELRELADKLVAVHSNEYDYAAVKPDVSAEKLERYRKIFTSTVYETEHPVVRVHPISGEKSLLLGHFVKRIKGYSQADSAHLFGLLQSHVIRQENVVRWRWKAGDVAIWDNRSTQHYAIDDYGTQDRVVRRVTLKGEVPVGANGQRSQTIKGAEIVGV
ncbi:MULTISPECIES: TauD/TfdA dioxygenase family protein [Pseudomonas]|uniref:TauD/TfdA family dioxygenase n=2 Tax=Pseudomonas TaxID=286 RepID=A0ABY3Q3Q9_9PSED|nr:MULTISPECIES: TauD/TfdA family dioxygenase [Pseudomonas]ABA71957.1 putative taurine dioxygenase [Pseudomonas fluorescens Pf0-1]EJM29642.1 putative taurine catabolism dioxygenase [Pseudomonas sp. GM25]MBL0795902.1 TauD/TfdA family dioxygenase [Pseudomonas sp. B7]MBY9023441.1 TauD/TfdA family dioxygenase [Pseudomonas fluorescens]MBY9029433.1 TauD/TfdA family dioxygenase [Pseudomonas fluorescens]